MESFENKPYRKVRIEENGEPLVALGRHPHVVLADPHSLVVAGAPYGGISPWYLRESVRDGLYAAADALQVVRPGWKFLMTDALRPVAVQFYMVEHTLKDLARKEGLDPEALEEKDRARLMTQVLTLWAVPSEDPLTPPPHSTGGAMDCTLIDGKGKLVPMGSEVDEMGPEQIPNHFQAVATQEGRRFHANREVMWGLLRAQGFERHPMEWWHFSMGDQLWAWLRQQAGAKDTLARFGRADDKL